MNGVLWRAAGLMGIYLLVLTSAAPGDVLIGGGLGLAVAVALRPQRARGPRTAQLAQASAAGDALWQTAREMVLGSWRVVRFCLGAPARPGFVEIPRGDRTRHEIALWGVLTGEAPDEIVVDVDEARDVLIVHLVEADDPEGVRARHRRDQERRRRRVGP